MVASDAPSVRSEVIAVIGNPDTTVIELSAGAEVAAAVAEHHPDLVIADLQMGNMGGMAVCIDLHLEESCGNLPAVPVLMLLDRRADVFLARRSDAEGFLVKPLDPIRVRRAVATLLGGGTYFDESFQPLPLEVAPSSQPSAVGAAGS